MIADLIKANRSCRRFAEDHLVDLRSLEELVDLARLSASGANLQPLKYILSCEPALNALIFKCLGWAAYLKDWAGPQTGERPAAYVVILGDSNISKDFGVDHGIAAQSILLGAREKGVRLTMLVPEQKGVLAQITGQIAKMGGNIVSLGTFLGEDPTNRLVTVKAAHVPKGELTAAMEALGVEMVDVREA